MAELDVTQMRLDIDELYTSKEDKASLKKLAYKDSLVASDIPNLDASKIASGSFASDRIPNLDASKIASGSFASDRIPNISAAKITSGTLPLARGGTGATTAAAARTNLGLGTAATTSPGDYVTEQGVSNGCFYIKWNSGNCLLYAKATLSSACTTSWGSMYESSAIQISWPFTLIGAPYEVGMVSGSGNASLTEVATTGEGTTTKSKKYNQIRPTSSNSQTLTLIVMAFGRWK